MIQTFTTMEGDVLTEKTIIFGSGPSAYRVAENLMADGSEIIIASPGGTPEIPDALKQAEILDHAHLTACQGVVGAFAFIFDQNGATLTREADYAVIAEETERYPLFEAYGLDSGERAISLSNLIAALDNPEARGQTFDGVNTVAFLTGLGKESHPCNMEAIMDACLHLKSKFPAMRCYVFTENLKVGAWGLEQKYRQTREADVVYIKFTCSQPEIKADESGYVIHFTDEITSGPCRLTADLIAVDEQFAPTPYIKQLARAMELETDDDGFVQADNVHRYIIATNRKGIVAVGPARLPAMPALYESDAADAALTVKTLRAQLKMPAPDNRALINNRCTQCLTCFRVCPFEAIRIRSSGKLDVAPWACERCGLCTAECPEHAITLEGFSAQGVVDQIQAMSTPGKADFEPHIVAFCCQRSAQQAAETAAAMNMTLPAGLQVIATPCAGVIGLEYILSAFRSQADGVLVLTCHPGNCHSGCGNLSARDKAAQAAALLETIGFEKKRLKVHTLAANMSCEFAAITQAFEKEILNLGPSGLKR